MRTVTSWLKINRTLGAIVAATLFFVALLVFGKATSGAGPRMSSKRSATNSRRAVAPKVNSGASLVPPFTGDHTETWEEFPTGCIAGEQGELSILGGMATIADTAAHLFIYEPDPGCTFGICASALAQVSDGNQGVGLDAFIDTATIVFDQPVVAFGAYWGGCGAISFTFRDANNNVIDTDSFDPDNNNGVLEWRGYHFDRQVKSIEVSGEYIVTDGMQVLTGCAPAPGGMVSWWRAESNASDSEDSNNGTFVGMEAYGSGEG